MNAARGVSDRDRIALYAAILMESGKAAEISDAIRSAAEALGIVNGQMPSYAAVRKHAQAWSMQSMGEANYLQSRRQILCVAEELLTVLEQAGYESLLIGRAAAGHLDADVRLHIRSYTDATVGDMAQHLVDFGYEEPQFDTINTTYGRLNRLLFFEQGYPVFVIRCPRALHIPRSIDVFNGKPKTCATAEDLRRRIEEIQVS